MDRLTRVGFAKVNITPTGSVPMAGYIARTSPSVGVHDPLFARCFLLYGEEKHGAIVVLDLVGITAKWVKVIQRLTEEVADIPQANVLVACTHTHSGPAGFAAPPWSTGAFPFVEETLERLRSGLERAAAVAIPVEAGVEACLVPGIGGHRTIPNRAVDQTLWTLVFRGEGKTHGVLANFPCHSTILGADNLFLSGDLFGAASAVVEQKLGPGSVVAITVGAAGDVSTRFTRREQTFAEVERLGGRLGQAIMESIQRARLHADVSLAFSQRRVWLPYKALPPLEEVVQTVMRLQEEVASLRKRGQGEALLRVTETRLEGAKLLEALISKAKVAEGVEAVLFGIRIGSAVLIGVPGEPFNELGWALRREWAGRFQVALAGLTGGTLGYFPSREAVEKGWYEALGSPFDWQATALIAQEAKHLLQELLKERGTT